MAVFAKVVDAGSFAAAARHFGMSPAMATTHVQTLEERLGVRLLNRTTRRVSATEVGRNFYERCLRILSDLEEAEGAAGELQSAPRGLLRVTAPVSFGTRKLTPAIADYLVSYPDVSIDLSLDDPYLDLLEKRFDLAIRLGHLADSSLIARKLCTLATILCASPGYLEKNGAPRTPRDLIGHNCLVYTYATPQSVWSFVDQNGKEDIVRISGRFLADSGDALLALVLRDGGVVLGPDYLVDDDLKAGRLIRLLPEYATPETAVHAVYPHSRHLSAKTRTFIDFLASRFLRSHGTEQDDANGTKNVRAPPSLHAVH
jgi:DNA-binding transcriptional LysR family regulator